MRKDSMQKKQFQKLNRTYTPIAFFENLDQRLEFQKYWQRYSKKMIAKQSKSLVKKMNKFFLEIKKYGHDDNFVKMLSIEKINDKKGYGVISKGKLPKGMIVTHYAGIIRKDIGNWGENNRYVFGFTGTKKLENWVIDAQKKCNMASFMNHSYKPNVEAFEYYSEEGPSVVFKTIKEISENEELVYDYGKDYWKGIKENPE